MDSNKLTIEVLNEIKINKLQSESIADKNLKKALLDSSFKAVYRELKELQINKSKLEFLKENTSEIESKIKEKIKELESILKELNMSKRDFEVNYKCSKCKDTGLLENEYCDCFYSLLNKKLIENIGVKIDPTHKFESVDFSIFDNADEMKKLYSKLSGWCDKLKTTKYKTIILSGAPGVGKTYLTECICNKLINKRCVINYYSAFALSDLFFKHYNSFNGLKKNLLDNVLECDVLIIDDFGAEPSTKNSVEYFYNLLNERLVKQKFTIVSTNLSPMQILDRYGERIFSRLNNKNSCAMFKISNKDLRLNLK